MEESKKALMKIFSSVLRERAKSETEFKEISLEFLRFFSRKDLIDIISNKIYNGKVPEEHNIAELENAQLLELIGDDTYVISYFTERWSVESQSLPLKPAEAFKKSLEQKRKERLEKKSKEQSDKKESDEKKETKQTVENSWHP